jgi:predicted transcriptional regulator
MICGNEELYENFSYYLSDIIERTIEFYVSKHLNKVDFSRLDNLVSQLNQKAEIINKRLEESGLLEMRIKNIENKLKKGTSR